MSRLMIFFAGFLLLFTGAVYVCLIAALRSLHSSDAAGNGLTQAFAAVLTIGLWVLLAGLLLIAGTHGAMPAWASVAAWLLVPTSGAAAFAAGQLLNDNFYTARWPLAVPVLVPLLLVAFALWVYLPALHAAVTATTASAFTWGAVLLLSAAPWPEVIHRSRHGKADRAKAVAAWEAAAPQRAEKEREDNLAAFQKLTPASDFSEWLEFRHASNELREQALQAIRQLPQRQFEIESRLQRGHDYLIDELQDFDLQPTPAISAAARRHLKQKVVDLTPRNPANPPQFVYLVNTIQPSLPAIKWLVTHRCGCDAELDAIETTVRLYADSPVRNRFLEEFAATRQAF